MDKKYCILCLKFGHLENKCGYKDWIKNTPLNLFEKFNLEYKNQKDFKEWKNIK